MMSETLKPGDRIAGHEIQRFVQRGGMGELYEARDCELDRRVALKLIAPALASDPAFRGRFRLEARAAAALDHPNVLQVYRADETPDGRLFLTTRFVDGGDLGAYVDAHGPLAPADAVAILGQIADALDAAHARGLIHRDVKPANVLLERRGDALHAYLGDFGLVKWLAASVELTETGALLGTIDYMAPEQLEAGTVDHRADVYAFGCLVYKCLTGSVPFPRSTPAAKLLAHAEAPIPLPSAAVPGLPSVFDVVVQRAMAKQPQQRAGSAGELMRWVAEQLKAAPVPVGTGITVASEGRTTSQRRWHESLRVRVGAHIAVYALLWTFGYLIGRGI